MKCNRRQLVFFLLSLLWMGTIFWFSSRTGNESSAQSGTIVLKLLHLFVPDYGNWDASKKEALIHFVTLLVRKSSHAAEYLLLGLLFAGCQSWKRGTGKTLLTAWLLVVCYAASDEIHQYFVPDRACMATDVLIDSLGAAAGLLLLCLVIRLIRKRWSRSFTQQ